MNLEALRTIADRFNAWIIQDSCHAPGGFFFDSSGLEQKCGNGNYADLAIFSFHCDISVIYPSSDNLTCTPAIVFSDIILDFIC